MTFFTIAIIFITANFLFLKRKLAAVKRKKPRAEINSSLPINYAYCFALWAGILILPLFFSFQNSEILVKISFLLITLILSSLVTYILFKKSFNAKKHFEGIIKLILSIATLAGIIITVLIMASILFEAIKFFKLVGIDKFLFGTTWNPQVAMREDQGVGDSAFGMIPVFMGTLLITVIAISISVPLGLLAAIYLSEYASSKARDILKPILEILAGIPTVVYGYFAATAVAPLIKIIFGKFGIEVASESALAAGFVMGIMIIPFILSLSDDAISSVPKSLKDGALAMGSTKSEMIKKVVLLSALPSIVGSILLAVSRAVGETMIVTMAAGLVAKLTFNPLDSVTTATAQIVTLLVGDQESDSPKTLAAFALGLILFIMTLIFNIIALIVVKKYKEKYE